MTQSITVEQASHFVSISLECLHREYPNVVQHVMNDKGDILSPRQMKPAFFGCFDWHSAVHNHWALVRLRRWFPKARWVPSVEAAINLSLTVEKIAGELAYIDHPSRIGFEMPYGMAWLLQLMAELREQSGDPLCERWQKVLEPLETLAANRFEAWLAQLPLPIRGGEHSQSAFAMGLVRDWCVVSGHEELCELIDAKTRKFHLEDYPWPFRFEPSAYDFLSPGLSIADLMRRVLPAGEFSDWINGFLVADWQTQDQCWISPVVCVDSSSGKFSHWEGLNLSRAWMLQAIASHCVDPSLSASLKELAEAHRTSGLGSVTGEHYAGAHWLVSFAVYLLTERWQPGDRVVES